MFLLFFLFLSFAFLFFFIIAIIIAIVIIIIDHNNNNNYNNNEERQEENQLENTAVCWLADHVAQLGLAYPGSLINYLPSQRQGPRLIAGPLGGAVPAAPTASAPLKAWHRN